jgi:hypothetical protein
LILLLPFGNQIVERVDSHIFPYLKVAQRDSKARWIAAEREYSPKWHTATASALAGWRQKMSPGDVPPQGPRPPK